MIIRPFGCRSLPPCSASVKSAEFAHYNVSAFGVRVRVQHFAGMFARREVRLREEGFRELTTASGRREISRKERGARCNLLTRGCISGTLSGGSVEMEPFER
jgi:hypothetical protein